MTLALTLLLTAPILAKPTVWTLTVGRYHGRGTSGGGGSEYTVDSQGMMQSVSYQNGVAGPQPHHYRSRVAHPELLPEVEKALRRLADSKPTASYDPTLEYHYTIDGQSGVASFHQDPSKPVPGLAGELEKSLDRLMRVSDKPQKPVLVTPLIQLTQQATPAARRQGWSSREYQIDSLGRVLVIYHRGNSNLEGTWEETLRTLTPAQLKQVKRVGRANLDAAKLPKNSASLLKHFQGEPLLDRPWMARP